MDKLKMKTPNKADENFKKLAAMFPNAVTETIDENGEVVRAIDKDVLMQEINTRVVDGKEERYQFTWPDKKKSVLLANAPISKTLRPCREESVDFDNTENLYIEGDNLEVLKLLQETYLGKIKMIYIDPPYNTGNDFVYEDEFRTESLEFREKSGNYDEQGNLLTDRMTLNTESNGRFHTDWLNMMYPRLKLARDLLSDDGVIFISIDEHEHKNLLHVMNEVFGEANYIDSIVWDKKGSAKGVPPKNMMVNVHEYIVAYQKSEFKFVGEKREADSDGFKNPDNDPRGPWRESNIKSTTKPIEQAFTIVDPNTGREYHNTWAFSKESLDRMIKENRILWKESLPKQKEFMYELTNENKAIKSNWGVFDAQSTTVYLKKLIPEVKFDNPKPINLMKYLISVSAKEEDYILDFFSGSATTAHATMEMNAKDGGNRKFIMVQIPEETDKNSEAYKAGYKNICEIGKERIRRAGDQILELRLESLEKEGVIEKLELSKEKLEKDAGKLSKTRSLEEIYGLSGNGVSTGEETSTGGNLRTVRPNEKSGGVDSVEHCGGAVKGKEGIYPIFENSKGFTSRTGDTIVDLRTLEVLNRFGYRINFEYIRGNQQNDLFADSESKLQTLRAKLSFLRSDHGFRVLKCDTSNMKDVFYRPDEVEQNLFDNYANNIKEDRTAEDLLFQTMLDLGVLLSSKIEETTIAGCKVFNVDEGFLYACFDKDITEDVITEIAKQKPYYFVMRDPSDSQDGDSLITNFEQIFATYSPNTQRKIL